MGYSLFFSRMTHSASAAPKIAASRAHSLRYFAEIERARHDGVINKTDGLFSKELLKKNLLLVTDFNGNLVKLDPENQDGIIDFYNKLKAHTEIKASVLDIEFGKNQKEKYAVTDYFLKQAKAAKSPLQAEFYNKIHQALINNEPIVADDEIQALRDIEQAEGAKIRGFAAKIKHLKTTQKVIEFANANEKPAYVSSASITAQEFLFKIPDRNNLVISDEVFKKMVYTFQKRFLPDFSINYIAIHHDENGQNPHAHFEINGKNNITGAYNSNQVIFDNVRKHYPDIQFSNENYTKLNRKDVRKIGVLIQNYIHNVGNLMLKDDGIDGKFKRRSAAEIAADLRDFSEFNKPIIEREFNRNNKLKAENDEMESTLRAYENSRKSEINKEVAEYEKEITVEIDEQLDKAREAGIEQVKGELVEYEKAEKARINKGLEEYEKEEISKKNAMLAAIKDEYYKFLEKGNDLKNQLVNSLKSAVSSIFADPIFHKDELKIFGKNVDENNDYVNRVVKDLVANTNFETSFDKEVNHARKEQKRNVVDVLDGEEIKRKSSNYKPK